jgi:RNA 3'-terminal phosphate cyclase (ATP)
LLTIDGSRGEGGGQILRTSLALSMVTGRTFRIERIRAGRRKPGLMRQHLTAVQAAAQVCGAAVEGATLGSRDLSFRPGPVRAGRYDFDVGTAGSATLVLQTVLPALLFAGGPSRLVLAGGTHNPHAPPFEFLERAFLPLLARMGAPVRAALELPGFYPAGGGRLTVEVESAARLAPLEIRERGALRARRAVARVSNLPMSIAQREVAVLTRALSLKPHEARAEIVASAGPGNVVLLEVESEALTEVFTGFGERGVRAETVAERLAREAREYLDAGVPVGRHLADQLLVLLALAGGGTFGTLSPSAHTTTNAAVIGEFLQARIAIEAEGEGGGYEVRVSVG